MNKCVQSTWVAAAATVTKVTCNHVLAERRAARPGHPEEGLSRAGTAVDEVHRGDAGLQRGQLAPAGAAAEAAVGRGPRAGGRAGAGQRRRPAERHQRRRGRVRIRRRWALCALQPLTLHSASWRTRSHALTPAAASRA